MTTDIDNVAAAYRILRRYEGWPSDIILDQLFKRFGDFEVSEIAQLIIEVEKISSKNSKPAGC